jgi:hypothetical protein
LGKTGEEQYPKENHFVGIAPNLFGFLNEVRGSVDVCGGILGTKNR